MRGYRAAPVFFAASQGAPQAVGLLAFPGGSSATNTTGLRIPRFNSESINVGAAEFTIECWLRPSATAADNNESTPTAGANYSAVFGNLFLDCDRFETGQSFVAGLDAGRICFGVLNASSTSQTIIGTTDIRDGQWHHVALYRDATSGTLEIFVDGDRESTVTGPTGTIAHPGGTGGAANDRYMWWGNEKAAVGFGFDGDIAEIRVSTNRRYNGATYTVPTAAFTDDANTVGLYHLNENTGTSAADSSGDGNTGTLVGSPLPTWGTADPFGGS